MKRLFTFQFCIVFLVFLTPKEIYCQPEVEVLASIQYNLFTKILAFDRNVEARTSSAGDLVIGILYQEKVRSSVIEKDEMVTAMKASSQVLVGGHKVTYKLIPLPESGDVRSVLSSSKVSMYYLTPLRGIDISSILTISHSQKILTLSGVPSYCDKGVSVCIEQVGEKAGIVIHLSSARLEGADLSSQLLKMARVIQ
jgi:YfiR/HmsC-like